MFREWKMTNGSEEPRLLVPDSENEKREVKKVKKMSRKKLDKRIDHVQAGLKADTLWDERSISECTELSNMIGDQFDDDTFNVKQEKVCTSLISSKC
jgi:hypothetical protein